VAGFSRADRTNHRLRNEFRKLRIGRLTTTVLIFTPPHVGGAVPTGYGYDTSTCAAPFWVHLHVFYLR
jgi:hypothetical protein